MVLKSFLTALPILLLINCSGTKSIEVQTVEKPLKITQPSLPAPVKLTDIKWKVIDHEGEIYYGLTINDYKVLASNMLELKRYIVEQKNIINYYRRVTGDYE